LDPFASIPHNTHHGIMRRIQNPHRTQKVLKHDDGDQTGFSKSESPKTWKPLGGFLSPLHIPAHPRAHQNQNVDCLQHLTHETQTPVVRRTNPSFHHVFSAGLLLSLSLSLVHLSEANARERGRCVKVKSQQRHGDAWSGMIHWRRFEHFGGCAMSQ
jgi:hypothetical protein